MISRQCPRCGQTSHSAGEIKVCAYCQLEIEEVEDGKAND